MRYRYLPQELKTAIRAFENDNVYWARKFVGKEAGPRALGQAFHQARWACGFVSTDKRNESYEWLKKRGLTGNHRVIDRGRAK